MNIQVLDKLFKAADDLNDEMIYEGFCHTLVPDENGVLCHKCSFYKGSWGKGGCMLNNALSILDEAKSVYKTLKNI